MLRWAPESEHEASYLEDTWILLGDGGKIGEASDRPNHYWRYGEYCHDLRGTREGFAQSFTEAKEMVEKHYMLAKMRGRHA